MQCSLSWLGAQFVGGKWLDIVEHIASHERGRKKVCLNVDQSYMACYEWNRILCGMHWIANGRDLVPEVFKEKWRGNNLPMWTFVLSEPSSTHQAHRLLLPADRVKNPLVIKPTTRLKLVRIFLKLSMNSLIVSWPLKVIWVLYFEVLVCQFK
jgi:hypothetical protein